MSQQNVLLYIKKGVWSCSIHLFFVTLHYNILEKCTAILEE